MPLGQKITLARRGPARVAGALLAEGHEQVVGIVLDNPNMNEAQILRALSRVRLPPAVVAAIGRHRKWSLSYNVRVALVRHPASVLATVLSFLPQLTVNDLIRGAAVEQNSRFRVVKIETRMRSVLDTFRAAPVASRQSVGGVRRELPARSHGQRGTERKAA